MFREYPQIHDLDRYVGKLSLWGFILKTVAEEAQLTSVYLCGGPKLQTAAI